MVAIDRSGVYDHLMRPRRLAQQFAAANPNIAPKHRVTVLGTHTKWYLQSQTVWPTRLYASIHPIYTGSAAIQPPRAVPDQFESGGLIGIGGRLATPPLPHHRAYGSRTTAVRPS